MPASISAVGLSLLAHHRDPTSTVLRQVEPQEERPDFSELAMSDFPREKSTFDSRVAFDY